MHDRPSNQLRERFIQMAWELGTRGGYSGVKVRAIAAAVGVSAALLYTYFEDKAALMDELRARGCAVLDAELERIMLRAHGRAGLELLCRGYLGYMAEHAWLYLGDSKRELVGPSAPHAEVFIRRVAFVLGGREHDLQPAQTHALHLWLALQGVIALMRGRGTWDHAFVESHLRLVLLGFTAQRGVPQHGDTEGDPAALDAEDGFAPA